MTHKDRSDDDEDEDDDDDETDVAVAGRRLMDRKIVTDLFESMGISDVPELADIPKDVIVNLV